MSCSGRCTDPTEPGWLETIGMMLLIVVCVFALGVGIGCGHRLFDRACALFTFTPAAANGESPAGPADAAVVPARRDLPSAAAMPAGVHQSAGAIERAGFPTALRGGSFTGESNSPTVSGHAAGRLQPPPARL